VWFLNTTSPSFSCQRAAQDRIPPAKGVY